MNTTTASITPDTTNRVLAWTGRLAAATGLALGLAACGGAAATDQVAAPTPAAETATTVVATADATATTAAESSADETDKPERTAGDQGADEPAAAPTTTAPPQPVECAPEDYPGWDDLYATADVNVRRGPGTHHAVFDQLFAGEYAVWGSDPIDPNCVVLPGSGVWWTVELLHSGETGWAHASYLESVHPGDVYGDGHDIDVHYDCLWLADGSCAEIGYQGDWIVDAGPLSDTQIGWAQLACVYQGDTTACDLLVFVGYPEGDYGVGNSLSMAPSEDLAGQCNHDPSSDPWVAMACAELDTRN